MGRPMTTITEATTALSFFHSTSDSLLVTLRISPKASRDAIQGTMQTPYGYALKVSVTAPPDKGKANAAVIALLAKAFGTPKSAITLVAGQTDRRKVARIAGSPIALSAIAQQWATP
jgi:uncharacterized protein (TIGR00251 family)